MILSSTVGPILVCSVYMPTDYSDECSLIMYQDVCAKIQSCFNDSDCVQVLIIDDLNCHAGSRFYPILSQLVSDNSWILSDVNRLSDAFTYISDSGLTVSWLDHVICSSGIDNRLNDISVLYGFIGSDHRPLSISVTGILCNNVAANDDNNIAIDCTVPEWAKVDDVVSDKYSSTLNDLLQNVLPPYDALACCTGHTAKCTDYSHRCAIDQYYSDVISCIKQCVDLIVPKKATRVASSMCPDGVILYRRNMMPLEQLSWNGFSMAGLVLVQYLSTCQGVGLNLSLLRDFVGSMKSSLIRGITRVNSWCFVSRQNLARNNVREVNPRV